MPGGTLSNYCERCGRRVDLRAGTPGDADLGFDRVKSAFRYCSACQLFVGRSCCWNPDVHACTQCGPPGSDQSVISPTSVSARKEILLRRLADLSESVDDLRKVQRVLDAQAAGGVAMSATAWSDAWDAASWMIARADTSRDAVARALWPPPPERSRPRFEQFHEELADLMKGYLAARDSIEQRLTAVPQLADSAQGLTIAARVRGWRAIPMLPALLGAVAAVLLVAGGLALLGREPETAILGGQGRPEQTRGTGAGAGETQASAGTPAPGGASEPAAPSVHAALDFDMLRVGALEGASAAIADVAGANEVVPFPSPFDRSVRMAGSGPHRFCVDIPSLDSREVAVALDLYAASLPFGGIELIVVPANGPSAGVGIPSELMVSLLPERWYHLDVRWQPGLPVEIEIRDAQGGEPISGQAPASSSSAATTTEGVCLAASGLSTDGELMLDNLRVEQ